MEYRPRLLDNHLAALTRLLPAIAVDGAKGVGKTASVSRLARETFSLDRDATRANVSADPELILQAQAPTFIDEWQRVASTWDVVRRAVDAGAAPGRFLLAGSAALSAQAQVHSGAGRIVRVVMRPMTLPERGIATPTVSMADLLSGERAAVTGRTEVTTADYAREILTTGLPGIRNQVADARPYLLDGYLDRIVDRDVVEAQAAVRRPTALRNLLAAYAAATATTASNATILRAAAPGDADPLSKPTSVAYRELLRRIWVLDPIPAWQPSFAHFRQLASAPKHHLVDPGLAARLVGATAGSLIRGTDEPPFPRDSTFLGALFESLAAQTVRVLAQACQASVAHLRTSQGNHEIDLIVQRADARVLAIEVTLSAGVRPGDVAHLNWLADQVPDRVVDKMLINTGERAFRRPDQVAVVPLALLGP
jgi:predicted AAA+ superfamily ATPase